MKNMDHEGSNVDEIRSILTNAEECLQEGRMHEARDIVLPLIPSIEECTEMIESERHRIKLRLYTILMRIPDFNFCEPEQLDAMATTQRMFRAPKEYTLAERLHAHVVYEHAKPDTVRGQEHNEWNALKTAQEVLDNTASNGELRALAHYLMCSRSLSEDEKQQHMEELFRIPLRERGPLLTTLCCMTVEPSIHIATDDQYIEQALTEVVDPFLKAKLFCKKMQSVVCRLVICENYSERMNWLEQHVGEMESLMASIVTTPGTERLMVYAHCIFAYRFACFGESDATYTHVNIAMDLAEILGDPDVIDIVNTTENMVEDLINDVYNEDDEDDDDDEGEGWKSRRED